MKLRILTLDSTLFSGEVTSVTLPGTMGSFQVLRNHAPLISSLTEGPLIYVSEGNVKKITINGGLVEVQDNTISVYLE
ncbi:MAG: F0F1 ATP synthase subunit epsilon [Bacteroidales bacterium]|nr:F0F1 ATP synthase subunit epsilon [Bacteroidales bacterium]